MTERFKVALLSALIAFLPIALVPSHVTTPGGTKGLNEGGPIAILVLDSLDMDSMQQSINLIKELGFDVTHAYPPHILIGHIPETISQDLIGQANISEIHYGFVDPSTMEKYGKAAVHAVEAWNNNFVGLASERGLVPEPGEFEPSPLIDDARLSPEPEFSEQVGLQGAPLGALYGTGFYDTSEYMIGSVAVGIILPESNGALEDWTSTEESNVISEIQAGLNWWATKEPKAELSFTYDIHYRVPTSYEPITLPSSQESQWINEVMTYLGYTTGDYFYKVSSYLNDLIVSSGTDWAVAIFVVDDTNDPDKKFADGHFGYAYLGGPFIVMTYGNDGYGIGNMDVVTAHEFGHSFYALDEYSGSPDGSLSSGYENVPNLNHDDLGPGVSCIMRGQVAPYTAGAICTWTRGQIGWWDDDGDNILNILDTFPETSFVTIPPSPTSDDTPTFTGFAQVVPLPNENPYGQGNDITLNKIVNVQYRVDGGSWVNATAVDGAFDNYEENFTFTTSPLADGTHTIEASAVNSVNNPDQTPASTSITIDTAPAPTILIVGNDNFTTANGVVAGSGMENDPYIIENWVISAENAHGIEIRNTNAYFIIRNCYVYDGRNENRYGIYFDTVTNGKIDNNLLENNYGGIILWDSSNNILDNNTCKNNKRGILFDFSDNNLISNNTCENNNEYGIGLYSSDNNLMTNNLVENNLYGIYLNNSNNNPIYHNDIMNNATQAYDNGSNSWDKGYPFGGNYWSDYTGGDNYRGENQDILGSDGIGDIPYYIPGDNNRDRYPLMNSLSVPHLGTAVFSLVNLYTINIEKILDLNQGSKLVAKFYTYGDTFENENVIENFSPHWHVEENESARHPEGVGVKKAKLDLTHDNTEDVISTIASFVVRKVTLEMRYTEIPMGWALASTPAEKAELEIEYVEIPIQWALAPS